MSAIKLFAILIFLVNSVYWNSASNQDDFYCQAEPLVYDICRRCNSTTEDCETSEKCQCDNIQIAGNAKDLYKLKGGSDCKTISSTTGEPWCYVSSTSPCNDKKISRLANTKNNLWHNNPIYYSYDACKPGIKETFQIGNEKLMEGVKILEDRLKSGDDDLSFYMESYEDCQEECHDRCGICGAWSFDNVEQICYLHTNDACCGQLNKRERNSEFTSGYICPWCSSTRNACPCKLRTRLLGTLGCSIAQSATDPNYLPPTGMLGVVCVPSNTDTCAAERRLFTNRRTGRKKCRSIKPLCAKTREGSQTLHQPCGKNQRNKNIEGCTDKRRCRERKLDLAKFPRC